MLVKSMHTFIKEQTANHLFYIQNALYVLVYETCIFCLASPYIVSLISAKLRILRLFTEFLFKLTMLRNHQFL